MLKNYDLNSLVTFQPKTDINFESFSQYVNGDNIEEIYNELEDAITSIQANGNPNIIFMDLSLKTNTAYTIAFSYCLVFFITKTMLIVKNEWGFSAYFIANSLWGCSQQLHALKLA